mgnify:CR=1 FL=1
MALSGAIEKKPVSGEITDTPIARPQAMMDAQFTLINLCSDASG